jgi:hypothetical protein
MRQRFGWRMREGLRSPGHRANHPSMTRDAGSSTVSAVRVVGRPFAKGTSGNLSGRPRASFDFAAAARGHTPEVLAMFLRSLHSNNWRERHSAGMVLLDRALGKPTQPISGEDGQPITLLHLVAVREVGEAIIAELAARQSSATIDGQLNGGPNGSDGAAAEVPVGLVDLSMPASE